MKLRLLWVLSACGCLAFAAEACGSSGGTEGASNGGVNGTSSSTGSASAGNGSGSGNGSGRNGGSAGTSTGSVGTSSGSHSSSSSNGSSGSSSNGSGGTGGSSSNGSGGTGGSSSNGSGGSGGGSTSSGHSSSSGSATHAADGGCIDSCPAPNAGVTFNCEKRFLFGLNYAWKNWGSDFGGGSSGVAGNATAIQSDLTSMQSHGVDVIRWWMFQELNGTGMALDSNGIPTGEAAGTLVSDIQTALSLAAQVGVHYNFTLFSFDDFHVGNGSQTLSPIITNSANLAKLQSFIALVAQTVENDPNKDRVVSWDVINEPEWAIGGSDESTTSTDDTGQDPYGDPVFNGGMSGDTYDLVTFAQMQSFVQSIVQTLHSNSSALVTVGSAAVKWKDAWQHVGLDYYTVHMYDWINDWYPYNASVSSYGFTLPVVMGEFPSAGLDAISAGTGVWPNGAPAVPYDTMLSTIFGSSVGYAGAMSWAYNDSSSPSFSWSAAEANVESFAQSEACVTHY